MGGRGISGVGVKEVGSGVEEGGGQSGRGGWAEVGDGLQGDRSGGGSEGGYGGDSSGGGVGGVFEMGTEDDRGREVAQVVVGTEDDRGREVAQVAIGSGRAGGPLRGGVSATQSATVKGRNVCDIVLDTGFSHTIIHQDLVPSRQEGSRGGGYHSMLSW